MKFDEMTDEDPKVIDAVDRAGEAAGWLWFRSILYSAKAMTDGFIPEAKVAEFRQGKRRNIAALLAADLWEKVSGGYIVKNFLDHNTPAAERKEARKNAANRQRRHRARNGGVTPLRERDGHGLVNPLEVEGEEEVTPNGVTSREDVESICSLLADLIEQNGSNRPTITQGWRDSARLLIDKDGVAQADVLTVIRWSQNDDFWRANILSVPKLRAKYDQLRLQSQRTARPTPVSAHDRETARYREANAA